ncbi:MAG: tetratricopeptide repeat protein, partial [Acidobacteria bacterium]|nr:tetratricopeptide repeat protein [Acidobacteriota bacterium]
LAPENLDVLKVVGETYLALAEADPRDPRPLTEAIAVFEKIRQAEPYALGERMTLGQIYSYLGQPESAIPVFREVIAASPRDRRAYDRLVQSLLAAGKTEEAEAAFREILSFDPEASEARLSLAELLAQRGEASSAVEVLREGSEDFRAGAKIRHLLAVQLYLSGEFSAALEELDRLSEQAAVQPPMGPETETDEAQEEPTAALRALVLSALGRNDEAATALGELLREDPANADIAGALSRVLVRMDRRQEAADMLRDVTLRLEETDSDRGLRLRFEWAEVLLDGEEWQQAVAVLDPVVASDVPQLRAAASLMKAEALSKLGRSDEALALLHDAAGGEAPSRAKEAEILIATGRRNEADAILRELAAGGDENAVVAAASVYQRLELYPEAAKLLAPFLEQKPDSPRALFLFGAANERTGRHAEAVKAFRRLLELEPDFPEALNYLRYMFAEGGENLDEAEQLVLR